MDSDSPCAQRRWSKGTKSMANNSPKSGPNKKKKEVEKTKFQIKLINRKLIGSHANVQRSTGCHAHARGRWVAHRVGKSDWMDPHRSQLELTNGFSIRRQVLFDSFNSIREAWVQKRGSEMGAEWGG